MVKFSYLAADEAPAGYEATEVPGAFVTPGYVVPVALMRAVVEAGYGPGDEEAEAILWGGEVPRVDHGVAWYRYQTYSSFPFSGWASLSATGLSVVESFGAVDEDVYAAFCRLAKATSPAEVVADLSEFVPDPAVLEACLRRYQDENAEVSLCRTSCGGPCYGCGADLPGGHLVIRVGDEARGYCGGCPEVAGGVQ